MFAFVRNNYYSTPGGLVDGANSPGTMIYNESPEIMSVYLVSRDTRHY